MYRLVNLSKYYNSDNKVNKALDNISLEIKQNEFVMISGPSGSGKSTLLNILSGIDSYQEGEMFFNNKETSYYDEKDYEKFRYENIAFVFQEYNLIESYTCLENIEIALISKNIDYNKEDIKNILKKVNLEDKLNVKAAKLSGGQKARLAIARALAFNSKILVLDEPTGALDSKSSKEVVELLKELKGYKTIIVVTHNEELFQDIANHHIKIKDGKIKEDKLIEETITKEIKEKNKTKKHKKEAKIALLNLKNQPKKTFFSFSLSLVLTIFIVLIISNLSYLGKNETTSNLLAHSFDRVVIQNENGFNEEEISSLSKSSYKLIKENILLQCQTQTDGLGGHYRYHTMLMDDKHLNKEDLLIGQMPKDETEVIMPYDKHVLDNWDRYNNLVLSLLISTPSDSNINLSLNVKIVGMSKYDYYFVHNGETLNSFLEACILNKVIFNAHFKFLKLDYNMEIGKIKSGLIEELKVEDKIIPVEFVKNLDYIIMNPKTVVNELKVKTTTISIFTENPAKFVKNLDSKYNYYIPNIKNNDIDFNRLLVTFLSIFMAGLIYLLVFLTNIITKQIYRYKNKDNAILNSLGYSTKTLKNSLFIELTFNYVISLFIMLILIILDYSLNIFKGFFTYNSIYSYIAILIILGLTIYSGIKNVFKMFSSNSLFKNLRGGDIDA